DRAETMFQEVRLITGEAMERLQARRRAKAERIACVFAATSCELAAVTSVSELNSIVGRRFPELGIPSCYISLFEELPDASRPARLLVAHDPDNSHLDSLPSTFPAAELAPEPWLNADRSRAYIVMLVHFDGKPLGFMTASLEASPYVYDTLGDMVGMAVDRIGRVAPDQVGLKVAAGR